MPGRHQRFLCCANMPWHRFSSVPEERLAGVRAKRDGAWGLAIAERLRGENQLSEAGPSRSTIGMHLRLLVVGNANFVDQLELLLEPIDVLLLGIEDPPKKISADIVAARLGLRDRRLENGMRGELQLEVARQRFLHIFAD